MTLSCDLHLGDCEIKLNMKQRKQLPTCKIIIELESFYLSELFYKNLFNDYNEVIYGCEEWGELKKAAILNALNLTNYLLFNLEK